MQRAFVSAVLIVYCTVWGPRTVAQTATPTPTPTATPPLVPKSCEPLPAVKLCSYTGLNGDCTIVIDRLSPITPPTLYARPNAKITIHVIDPSPYETLSLDWKSTTAVVPPDSFATVFSALTGNLGKFTAVATAKGFVRGAPDISEEQQKLLQQIQGPLVTAQPALEKIQKVLEPPPLGVCSTHIPDVQPWLDPVSWKDQVEPVLKKAIDQAAQSEADLPFATLQKKVSDLAAEIQTLRTASEPELVTLNLNQITLTDAMNQRKNLGAHLAALLAAIDSIPKRGKGPGKPDPTDNTKTIDPTVAAFPSKERAYQNQVWVLNYVNTLAPTVKKVSVQTSSGGSPSGQTDSQTKQPLATLTVQFQTNPRFEVSTGLMVPLTPYHSFSAAAVATNGTVTGNVVQVTRTYTVVPMVSTNILVKDFIAMHERAAWFGSVAVGYNPATSSVEFGVGPSFSWRSIVISGLADIGRDTELAGGFTVGQTLPANNPPKPLTTTIWSVKPAVALSIRIPLGGTSKQGQ
jgi:hypothetical protein